MPDTVGSLGRGIGQPDLSGHNQRVVIDAIRRAGEGGISRVEITIATGLSPQTVTNVTQRLLTNGLVTEAGQRASGPGRPRTQLRLNPDGAYAFGVHIDPLVVDVLLMDWTGTIRGRRELPTPDDEDPRTTLTDVAESMDSLASTAVVPRARVKGVGIATPGPISQATQSLVDPPLMRQWHGAPVGSIITELTGFSSTLTKDVTACAMGELWTRSPDDHASFLFCYVGTGVGVAATIEGIPHRGVTGNAGEVGPRPASAPPEPCRVCSNLHPGLASAPSYWARVGISRGLLPEFSSSQPHPRHVARATAELATIARAGDFEAQQIFADAGGAISRIISSTTDLLDLDEVVLGGPYWDEVGDLLLPSLIQHVQHDPVLSSVRPVTLRSCLHRRDASAIGAASGALQQFSHPL